MGNSKVDRLLIVGLGSIGRRHAAVARRALPGATLAALRRPGADGAGPCDILFTGLDDALAWNPDAAVIATPAPLHLETAIPLARAGVPLLIEKPLAADPIPADAFAEAKAPIQVGYCLRFQPALAAVAAAVWDGAVGTVRLLRAQVGQYLPDWRPGTDYRAGVTARADLGGGALRELSHEIDLALWLGGPVSGVRARLANTGALGIETEEVADLALTFASGAVGSVQVDLLRRAPRRLLSVTGDDGTAEWDGIAATARLFKDGAWTDLTPPDDGGGDMYDRQFRHFLARVADGAAPLVGPDAGRAVLDVVAAARRSDDEGGDIAP